MASTRSALHGDWCASGSAGGDAPSAAASSTRRRTRSGSCAPWAFSLSPIVSTKSRTSGCLRMKAKM
eukprot:13299926-Heterocapsa_arctica.AAC.1